MFDNRKLVKKFVKMNGLTKSEFRILNLVSSNNCFDGKQLQQIILESGKFEIHDWEFGIQNWGHHLVNIRNGRIKSVRTFSYFLKIQM